MFSDLQVVNSDNPQCPSGYEVLFQQEWPGLDKACDCLTWDVIAAKRSKATFKKNSVDESSKDQQAELGAIKRVQYKDEFEYF